MSLNRVIAVMLSVLLLSACGLTGQQRWAAYEVDVRVMADGKPVSGASVSYMDEQVTTDENGLAKLRYMVRGVKVVTVSAPGWLTVQQRLAVPVPTQQLVDIELTEPNTGFASSILLNN
ncbi:MAG: carboxypeptidase-like regulatory domain-containing protein [Gammaproteobacteria bacterium]|nr:carboxypeptidase-like regulatory domain-containing protein [Gammaproteobacteria bacterium]